MRSVGGGMTRDEIVDYILEMPDEVMSHMTFTMPWQYNEGESTYKDPDDFPVASTSKETGALSRIALQEECWNKFQQNPQVNTSIRGLTGRITGLGFEVTSEILEIQQVIDEITLDWRNRLYSFWPKFVARTLVEGELFLILTLHENGFVEVDFIDPTEISTSGDDGTGIIFHPNKSLFPLFYNITLSNSVMQYDQIPSVFVARYPELDTVASEHKDYVKKYQKGSRSRKKAFRDLGGFYRFVVAWDKGYMTRRAVGYLRTTLVWLNHYENLKQYEIDHKKAAGAYVWTFNIEDPRMFKIWLSLSDEEKRKTGIMAKKTPGSSLILPPGVELKAVYPQLSSIKEQDTDILHMVTSGLNEPEDVSTGQAGGTYASVKASRGPMSDRTSDEIAYFQRWLMYDFYAAIFYLRSMMTKARFPKKFKVREAVRFDDEGEPVFETVTKPPEQLIDVSFPTSEVVDFEARAKGLLGTKHGPISQQIGVPNSEVAKRMGIGGYGRMRLRKATEDEKYPELIYEQGVDAESIQETVEGEPKKAKKVPRAKKEE